MAVDPNGLPGPPVHLPLREWARAVKKHAEEHYNEAGWDFCVETMTEEDIVEFLVEEHVETLEKALERVGWWCQLLDERRRDIQATAW